MQKRSNSRRILKYVVSAILFLMPVAVYFDVPLYNVVNPIFAGLPFFYWFQLVMLPVSALCFFIAVLLLESNEKEKSRSS